MTADTLAAQRARQIEANRHEYGEHYPDLTFPTEGQAAEATARRTALLADLAGRTETGCGGTKLDMHRLSPGCRICTEGAWSCLFVSGRCNARCFYCPSRQDETGLPGTNTVNFRSPADYVAYLEQFGFRGMSLSGGEPLLTPGRTFAFLGTAKRRFGAALHAWLYTNGTLVDRDLLLRLRDAGLDEIRFDIGAVGYALDKARLAVGIIPTVTVEIPAVPEKLELLRQRMAEMADAGIAHLNLHQLRLTPYSRPRFAGRPYTYLHGDKVTVLESELTALELLRYSLDQNIDLPVNYCSFVFKHRHQKAAARRRAAEFQCKPLESVTQAGYLRSLALSGNPERLAQEARRLQDADADSTLWSHQPTRQRLFVAAELLARLDLTGLDLVASYDDAGLLERASGRNAFRELRLPSGRKLIAERSPVATRTLSGDEVAAFLARQVADAAAEAATPADLYETVAEGLQDYF